MDPYVITTKPKIAHLCFLPIEWILISSQENAAPLGIIGSLGAKYHRRANLYSNRNHPEQINKHAWDISRNRREKSTRKRGPTMKNLVEGDVVGLKEDARNPLFFFANTTLQSQPGRARSHHLKFNLFFAHLCALAISLVKPSGGASLRKYLRFDFSIILTRGPCFALRVPIFAPFRSFLKYARF